MPFEESIFPEKKTNEHITPLPMAESWDENHLWGTTHPHRGIAVSCLPGILLPRAVKVPLSKAHLLISNDFSAGKNRSLLRRFSEELPMFLLVDKSNSWRLESKGITWAVKRTPPTCFRHHVTKSPLAGWFPQPSWRATPASLTHTDTPQKPATLPRSPSGLFYFKPLSRLEVKSKDFRDRQNWVLILALLLKNYDCGQVT